RVDSPKALTRGRSQRVSRAVFPRGGSLARRLSVVTGKLLRTGCRCAHRVIDWRSSVSIAHLGSEGHTRPDSAGTERTPPHDLLAEQSALGGMLLSKDATADVIEEVRAADFYIPKHEIIFEAVLSLYPRGEPTDVIAVTDELAKTGDLARAGGAEYLHTLTGVVPTAANAGYYASIVAERALLRRLVDAGTRITQMGYSGEGNALELVNDA